MEKPDFNIGELVITLSVQQVMDRYGIDQGFGRPGQEFKPFVCKVVDKQIIMGYLQISVDPIEEDSEYKHLSGVWLDQHIFESYLPILREDKLNKILNG
jgi:hypothetical protein